MIEPAIADALEAHRRFMADPALVRAYELAEKEERDRLSEKEYWFEEGQSKGIDIGRSEGIDIGIHSVARNLLDMGRPLEEITTATGLTEAEIRNLRPQA